MLTLLNFTLITLLFIFAQYHAMLYFNAMIQEDGMLDRLFGYRKMLDDLYGSESKWKRSLGDALGNCAMCQSFWMGVVMFIGYSLFMQLVLDLWVTDLVNSNKWYVIFGVNLFWFWMIHAVVACVGFLALKKDKK